MPEESKATQPAAAPPAPSDMPARLPQPLFLLLFWSTWVRERLLILLPALTVLCLGLSMLGPMFARMYAEMLPGQRLPSQTQFAFELNRSLEHGWPVLLLLVVFVLLLPTVLRHQLRNRFPADALPDLACLRLWDRLDCTLASVVLVVVVCQFLFPAFLLPLMIGWMD